MLVSVNVLAYWVSPLRLVLNLTKSLSWITPPPDSLHSAYALEAMKNAAKAAVANRVDTFIFMPLCSIYPKFSEEFKRIKGEVSPNGARVERHPARSGPAARRGTVKFRQSWWAAGTRVRDDEVAPKG